MLLVFTLVSSPSSQLSGEHKYQLEMLPSSLETGSSHFSMRPLCTGLLLTVLSLRAPVCNIVLELCLLRTELMERFSQPRGGSLTAGLLLCLSTSKKTSTISSYYPLLCFSWCLTIKSWKDKLGFFGRAKQCSP